jgi:protease I
MHRILLVVASRDFRDEEARVPRARFEEAGCEVALASTRTGPVRGSFGAWLTADLALTEARARDFDAVVFAGGEGVGELFDNRSALRLCRDAVAGKRVLGALCAAPSILAAAGVLKDRRATCWPPRRDHLASLGAVLCEGGVVIDPSGIVTADGPHRAADFATAVLGLLGKKAR